MMVRHIALKVVVRAPQNYAVTGCIAKPGRESNGNVYCY